MLSGMLAKGKHIQRIQRLTCLQSECNTQINMLIRSWGNGDFTAIIDTYPNGNDNVSECKHHGSTTVVPIKRNINNH